MTIRQLGNAAVAILATLNYATPADDAADAIRQAVTLRASFDEAVRADHGRGELSLSTRFNHETDKNRFVFEKGFDPAVFRVAPKAGIVGGALEVVDVLPRNGRIFFPARGNIAYRKGGWAGSVSVWLKTDPNTMLKTRFCDPVQITERGAGNGGIWFDFNDAKPRDLRMGTFPAVTEGGKPIAESDPSAPVIWLKGVGFKASEWHHVVMTWEGFDTDRSNARTALYVDGKPIGELKDREIGMEWDLDKAGIYLAVGYIGLLDEFAVFNRALTQAEIGLLFQRPGLLSNRQTPGDLKTLARQSLATIDGQLSVTGLQKPVEVIRDKWGIPHIYAQTVDDVFFAQGYVMAQDRLWQMEWWRRQREGRLAEILGPAAVERDRQARLTKFRGPFDQREWTTYHPEGKRLFSAYVKGINAYIADNAESLPVELKLTGIRPEPWTPETVLLRANERALADAAAEIRLARSVAQFGVAEANRLAAPDPWDNLEVPHGLDVRNIGEDVLQSVRVGGRGQPVALPKPEIVEPYRKFFGTASAWMPLDLIREPGSNNWVMSGKMTTTGKPMVVNDPHREVTNPSLRYLVHLNAPGWNVIGASEAPFIGVHIGHNANLGWGMTVVGTDQVDVMVEEMNPANANEVLYNGKWEPLRIVREEIKVKGEAPREVELKFSRHGAVFYEDTEHKRAYVLRSVMDEPGTAWYLGSLRLAQATTCSAFLDAAMYWKTPSENLICGDKDGNIAWQASGLAPSRVGWSGRLPVPGTGKYEWQGFRQDLPREFNPDRGFVATANHNIHPKGYSPPLMFKSPQAAERITRILQVIKPGKKFSIEDQKNLQLDMYLTRAEENMALFEDWKAKEPEIESARMALLKWNKTLRKESMEAALYVAWREAVDPKVRGTASPLERRFELAQAGLEKAIQRLTKEQGPDRLQWRYGRLHTRALPHPFVSEFDLPTVERGGGAGTVAADGASFREILDAGDWDRSVVTQVPGQSGQPESKFYGNLLPLWADNEYLPLVFSRKAVDKYAAHRLILKPR